jgi:hypothetical protein
MDEGMFALGGIPLKTEDLKRWSKDCVSHHYACDCREYRFKQIEEAAKDLAGAVWRLDESGFIGTFDDYDEAKCQHLREIANQAVDRIRVLTTGRGESNG